MSPKPTVDRNLLTKFFAGQCTATEQEAVRAWLLDPENEVEARSYVADIWDKTSPDAGAADTDALLTQTWRRIAQRQEPIPLQHTRPLYWRVAAALLVLAAATATVVYLARTPVADSTVIGAGGQELSSTAGQIIMKILPDGTKVWLNARSTMRYPKTFAGLSEREVWLDGEAYFDVVKDRQHPFVVHAPDVNIRVLGTAFNVKSYAGDPTVETTLVHGKVALETTGPQAKKVEMHPNQQAVFSRTSDKLALAEVETGHYTSWISGSLVFEDSPVRDVISALERWYGVTIHLQNQDNLNCRLTARIDKESLTETLDLLHSTTGITYTVNGDRVEIQGTLCNTSTNP
jgi:transmembrane sensor